MKRFTFAKVITVCVLALCFPTLCNATTPELTSISRTSAGHIVLLGRSDPNAAITIQVLASLKPGSFTFLVQIDADDQGTIRYEDSDAVNVAQRFYRLADAGPH
ncbi:MAG TPA: hypothetical protein VF511_06320 [Chthoniobacterales bacterium]|jgi:hypothetical protein